MRRVVTWNIRFGEQIDAATDLLADHPELSDADALLLQELDSAGADRIASRLGLEVTYSAACIHPQTGREFGNAILSRSPLRDTRVVELPHEGVVAGTPRIAIRSTTELDGREIALWSTHTEIPTMRPDQRRRQFRAVAGAVGDDRTPAVVLGGDFNTVTSRGVNLLTSLVADAGFERVRPLPAATVTRAGRKFSLDHVFHRGVEPVASGVVAPGRASDHSALWFEFRL